MLLGNRGTRVRLAWPDSLHDGASAGSRTTLRRPNTQRSTCKSIMERRFVANGVSCRSRDQSTRRDGCGWMDGLAAFSGDIVSPTRLERSSREISAERHQSSYLAAQSRPTRRQFARDQHDAEWPRAETWFSEWAR